MIPPPVCQGGNHVAARRCRLDLFRWWEGDASLGDTLNRTAHGGPKQVGG
jgi:hypothetical protein